MGQVKISSNKSQLATKSKKITTTVTEKLRSVNELKMADLQKVIILTIDPELDKLAAKNTVAPKTEYLRKVFANSKISG